MNPGEELEMKGHPGVFAAVNVLERDERKRVATTADTSEGTVSFLPTQELDRLSATADAPRIGSRVHIFVSYAHTDFRLVEIFKTNLDVIKADGLAEYWVDELIAPSTEWDTEIRGELESAQIIVLMVSTAFLKSAYIRGVELARAVQLRDAKQAEIFIRALRTAMCMAA